MQKGHVIDKKLTEGTALTLHLESLTSIKPQHN